ncbi:MAG: hypothetical protein PHI32_08100, partial [Dysgonamonadaceae bacterium]|nr:hypothetical protein [Dysgonamonadaceae bacterium]MDD4729035.1 hypothetical protein [Dysgonamonadaceae bacterium]
AFLWYADIGGNLPVWFWLFPKPIMPYLGWEPPLQFPRLLGQSRVQDLIDRNAKKIILITWTDNKDFSWVNQYNPCHVVYDAEEENPEYHQRVKEIELKHPRLSQQIKRLPQYAKSTPGNYLIQIHCDKCRCSRWARLNKPYPGKTALGNAELGEFSAACLMCGYEAWDSYNWSR